MSFDTGDLFCNGCGVISKTKPSHQISISCRAPTEGGFTQPRARALSGRAGRARHTPFALPLVCALACLLAASAGAATVTVTTTLDEVNGNTSSIANLIAAPGGAGISLREAIIAANNTPGADVITLPAGTYTLTRAGNDSTCQTGDLDINGSLTLTGAGAATTIIQAATDAAFTGSIGDKVLGINQDGTFTNLTVSISGVTIRYGRNTVPFGDPSYAYSGAGIDIFLTGTGNAITIANCVITGNENVNSYGGGVNIDSSTSGLPGDPAVNTVNRGTVTFIQCTIANNKALMTGGGANLFSDIHNVVFNNCVVSNNVTTGLGGMGASGGGLNIRHTYGGSVAISNNTVIANNTGVGFGGGVCVPAPHLGPVTLANTTISGNTVLSNGAISSEGGGLYNQGANTALTNVVIASNHADMIGTGASPENPEGGGVLTDSGLVTITGNSFITNNTAVDGAGIFNRTASSTTTITGATIAGNRAKNHGGGVGVLNGSVTLTSSTLVNNVANSDGTGGGDGGAIAVRGGTLTASYCRVVGNTAANGNAVARSAGTASVANNWWGTNNPAGLMNGTVAYTPWLQLMHTAAPNTIFVPNATTLTATFLTNSAGTAIPVANLARLVGLPITFNNAVRGTLSGASTTIQSAGTATATYTANTAGAGSADATVDGSPVTAAIAIPTGVSSINRVQTTPTNLSSVQWTVTFSNAVSGVVAGNFNLVNGGLGGAPAIGSVTAVGGAPASVWTVTASTGSGTGTLGLNMANGTGVSASIVNLPFTGQIYTLDLVAPDTTITAHPANLTNTASASFSFTGSDSGVGVAGFQCQLDGAPYTNCNSPVSFTGLSSASHTFNVRAVDGAGNPDPSPATFAWTSDTIPPTLTCATDIVVTANGRCPAVVAYSVSATDNVGLALVTTNPPSGSAFPVGTNAVVLGARDTAGNTNFCTFRVIVLAGAPPRLSLGHVGTNVVLSWSNVFPCYTLQSTPVLLVPPATNVWTVFPGPYATNGGNIYATNGIGATNRSFFRMVF